MKALTIAQPWAALIAYRIKRIETRPAPPNGPMRPDGVRGLPGLTVERGERIGIHAAAATAGWGRSRVARSPGGTRAMVGEYEVEHDRSGLLLRGDALAWPYRLPLGALVATAVVIDTLPIVAEAKCAGYPAPLGGMLTVSRPGHPIPSLTRFVWGLNAWTHRPTLHTDGVSRSDQLPYGTFTPGRWAWLLDDVQPLVEPIPCKGRQGVWRLPPEVECAVKLAEVELIRSL